MSEDKLYKKFKQNVYLKPDEYLNGWAKLCGWKASLVYDSLWRHADTNGCSFPSIELMAEEHGVNRKTIIKGLKTLVDFNLVKKEQGKTEGGKFLNNTYTLTDKAQWKTVTVAPEKDMVSPRPSQSQNHVLHRDYKDTHIKGTHNNTYTPPPVVTPQEQERRPAKRLAGKPYSKPEWLLSLGNDDIEYIQEEFPEVSAVKIREIAKECYYWQKTKEKWQKDQKMTLRNWVKNDVKWGKEKAEKTVKPAGYFQQ